MRKTAVIAMAALAIALAATGCATARDPGGAAGAAAAAAAAINPALNGAWAFENGAMIAFDDGSWAEFFPDGEPYMMGTFTTDGGVIFLTVAQISGPFMAEMLGVDAEPRWHSLDEMRGIFVEIMADYGIPAEAAAEYFDHRFGLFSVPYSVSGDALILGVDFLERM